MPASIWPAPFTPIVPLAWQSNSSLITFTNDSVHQELFVRHFGRPQWAFWKNHWTLGNRL